MVVKHVICHPHDYYMIITYKAFLDVSEGTSSLFYRYKAFLDVSEGTSSLFYRYKAS